MNNQTKVTSSMASAVREALRIARQVGQSSKARERSAKRSQVAILVHDIRREALHKDGVPWG